MHTSLNIINTSERTIIDMKQLGIRDMAVIGKYHYTRVHDCLQAHAHTNQMEICYCSRGEQAYIVDNEYYLIRGGDVFITFPNEMHGTGHFPEEKGELFWIIIDVTEQNHPQHFLHLTGQEAKELVAALRAIRNRSFSGNRKMKALLDQILTISTERVASLLTIKLYQLITGFLLEVLHCSKSANRTSTTEADTNLLLKRLNRFIEQNIDRSISIDELASVASMSLSYFKSWFRETTGYTPLDYILRRKIRLAKQELEYVNKSITAISFDLGFSSSQYFSTVFRKYTGCSPSAYRKQKAIRTPIY